MTEPENDPGQSPLFSDAEWENLMAHVEVTGRKAEVLRWLMRGLSDPEIAESCDIDHSTVRSHISLLFQQFQVKDRTALAVELFRAFRHLKGRD